jgi:hypothetical protein
MVVKLEDKSKGAFETGNQRFVSQPDRVPDISGLRADPSMQARTARHPVLYATRRSGEAIGHTQ